MRFYYFLKVVFTKHIIHIQKRFKEFNSIMYSRKYTKEVCRKINAPKLAPNQIEAAKAYYKARGYKLKNTYWHRYITAINGVFREDYVPFDIFIPFICPRLNELRQWPTLLDKNLTYNLFKEFEQPKRVVQNINGFYFIEDKMGYLISSYNHLDYVNKISYLIQNALNSIHYYKFDYYL